MRIDPRNTPLFWWKAIILMCIMIALTLFLVDDNKLKGELVGVFLGIIIAAWNTVDHKKNR